MGNWGAILNEKNQNARGENKGGRNTDSDSGMIARNSKKASEKREGKTRMQNSKKRVRKLPTLKFRDPSSEKNPKETH